MPQYKRPPITEAVIEFRFAHSSAEDICQRAANNTGKEYFYREIDKSANFKIDVATGKTQTQQVSTGVKLSSIDRTDVIIFRTASFVASRLAPYLGWEHFRSRARAAWGQWRKVGGSMDLSRIGLRYVNRIDVRSEPDEPVSIENYLNVYPETPDGPPLMGYTMQVLRDVGADDCRLVLNSGSVVAPLIGFTSFVLDLDVFRENELPLRDDELWALLEKMRQHKNNVFESCITPQARIIFDQ
jgi:uncharacterized protein (TIGR04255 family)